MNPFFARFLNSVYRKEPISGFILIAGVTDALIGGAGGHWNLFSIGLFLTLFALALRSIQDKKIKAMRQERPLRYQLPPGYVNRPLPLLTSKKSYNNRKKRPRN